LSLVIRHQKKSLVIRKKEKGTKKQEVFRLMNDYFYEEKGNRKEENVPNSSRQLLF